MKKYWVVNKILFFIIGFKIGTTKMSARQNK